MKTTALILFTGLLSLPSVMRAELWMGAEPCFVRVEEPPPSKGDTDGPGSFGALHEAMSLGCLAFLEIELAPNGNRALLMDYLGKKYNVGVGDYVGESSGLITEISQEMITIRQLVIGASGEYKEVIRFLFRGRRR
jgi:hypothetical protein